MVAFVAVGLPTKYIPPIRYRGCIKGVIVGGATKCFLPENFTGYIYFHKPGIRPPVIKYDILVGAASPSRHQVTVACRLNIEEPIISASADCVLPYQISLVIYFYYPGIRLSF